MTAPQQGKRKRSSNREKVGSKDADFWATLKELEQLPPDAWDFEYVKTLPKHLQRMAAFWEYARESKPLRNAFETGPKLKEKEIQSLLLVLSPDEMRLLASPYFPALSFERMIGWNLLDKGLHTSTDFGTTAVGFLPIEQFVPFALWLKGQKIVANWTIHGAKIEWDYTDAELSDMFRAQLKDLRPVELPEPKRAGRAGRQTASPVDSLNQLAALRLDREGITLFKAREVVSRVPYTSVKGWNLGIRAAKERINNMASVRFFGKRSARHS